MHFNREDDTPERVLVRSLDPQFLHPGEAVVIALLEAPSALPVVDGKPRELQSDLTVLIQPVVRIEIPGKKKPK